MKKIFIVEDDENIRELIIYALKSANFEPVGFPQGADFFQELNTQYPDLVILDVMLPKQDGLSILKQLKMHTSTAHIPVIILSAKSSELDRINGLDLGSDDYMTKPFSVLELISRIKAVIRRTSVGRASHLNFREISLSSEKRTVKIGDEKLALTFKEFELLHFLLQNVGLVLSREQIFAKVWGEEHVGETRTVDMHINTLRKKLGQYSHYIETVRGLGYKVGE